MSLEDFFDLSKPIKRKTISAGTCAGRMLPQPREKKDDVFRDIPDNVEYAREHKDDLKRRLREVSDIFTEMADTMADTNSFR